MKGKILLALMMSTLLFPSASFAQHQDHGHTQAPEESDRERFYWQMPESVLDALGVKEGMKVADVGCGNGYFTLRLARRVGAGGSVYASDIDAHALEDLRAKARAKGFEDIKIILGREDDPLLPAGSTELILIVNVLHLVDDPRAFLRNTAKGLVPGGRLAFVQWDAAKMDPESLGKWDPRDRGKHTMRTTLRKLYDGGFEVEAIETFLPVQNIYICRPAGDE